MKIAIIGTSPIALILSQHLSNKEKNTVHHYNIGEEIGGAWSCKEINKTIINTKSNIIYPTSEDEFHALSELPNTIEVRKKIFGNIKVSGDYNPPFTYDFDLPRLFKDFKIKIISKTVKNIKETEGKVLINSSAEYDIAYIPTHAKINQITVNNEVYSTPYETIESQHLTIITKEELNLPFYQENIFGSLDRIQYRSDKENNILTGRISKEFKEKHIKTVIKSLPIELSDNLIIHKEINEYKNYYRNKENEAKLSLALDQSESIRYLETSQFPRSYLSLLRNRKISG